MAMTATQQLSQPDHPWVDTMITLAQLDVDAIVIRIDHAKTTAISVKNALLSGSRGHSLPMLSGCLNDLMSRLSVIDYGVNAQRLLNGAADGDFTQSLLRRMNGMTTAQGLDFLTSICQGKGEFALSAAPNQVALRGLIHLQTYVGENILCLISLRQSCVSSIQSASMPLEKEAIEPGRDSGTGLNSETQRLAMAGKVASHILHEINNPLTVIQGKADKITRFMGSFPAGEGTQKVNDCVGKILEMIDRINKIIRGMKNFTRNNADEALTVSNLSSLVSEVLHLVALIAKKNSVVIKDVVIKHDLALPLQRLRMSQVLVNLLNNAIEAIAEYKDRWVEIKVTNDDQWAYIRLSDSGIGIPENLKSRLFETYFSTKGSGQGSGIGLSLSRDIVREHGGDLYLDEASDHTCFVIQLPMRESEGAIKLGGPQGH